MTDPYSVPVVPGRSPAAAPAMMPTAPQPPRTKNSTILWICGGLCAALVLAYGFVSVLGAASNKPDAPSAAADVSKPSCGHATGSRRYIASVYVKNSTDRTRDYSITVAFLRDGSEITTGTARLGSLQPGKGATVEVVGLAESELLIGCEVTSVRRS